MPHHPPCVCALPSSASISSFISTHPSLSMLETKCKSMRDLKQLHAQVIKTGLARDTIAVSRVLAFCATSSLGDINYAMLLFSHIPHPNPFTWNTIIRGFSHSPMPHQAIYLFCHMLLHSPIQPQRLTYPPLFRAYAQMGLAHEGAQLHARILKLGLESDPFIRNSMIFMYAICGHLVSARLLFDENSTFDIVSWNSMILGLARNGEVDYSRRLFDKMLLKNTISWNSMISGCVGNGRYMEALDLFHQMQNARIEPSEHTMASLLGACTCLGALEQGEWIHAYIEKNGIEANAILLTAIIDMYCKCGRMDKALLVFENAPRKGLSSWNSIISGLAIHGCGKEAIQVFLRLQSSNLRPDHVSFLGILTACNHSGMVDEARYYFSLMIITYKIQPTIKHYGCMVDLLGRAGHLKEAEMLIGNMPIEPDVVIWGSLLSACRNHGNIEIGERVAKHIIKLDPMESSSYVLLSNAYAAAGRFTDAVGMRQMMKQKQVWRDPGCSMVEIDGVVHEFVVDGRLHPQAEEIRVLLHELDLMSREAGHPENPTMDLLDFDCLCISER